jgi:hypothetical protein
MTAIMAMVGRIFGIVIPVPVVLILAALAWVHFDKHSSIRSAVNERVKELVAGAELAAIRAERDAERVIAARAMDAAREAERRSQIAIDAQAALAAALADVRAEKESLNAEIDDLLSRPVSDDCAVDRGLFDRLRSR